jgi:hypothetical protein
MSFITPAKRKRMAEKLVKEWNQKHPPGTRVRYWPGARHGDGTPGKTIGEAYVLEGHTAVIGCEADDGTGGHGCLALTHVDPISQTEGYLEVIRGKA